MVKYEYVHTMPTGKCETLHNARESVFKSLLCTMLTDIPYVVLHGLPATVHNFSAKLRINVTVIQNCGKVYETMPMSYMLLVF